MKGPCAGVVVLSGETGRVLLLQRSNGRWEHPGGHLDPGEGYRDAAVREMREETGHSDSMCVSAVGIQTGVRGRDYVSFVGLVPHEFEPTTPEHVTWGWFEPTEPLPQPLHPGAELALAWSLGL